MSLSTVTQKSIELMRGVFGAGEAHSFIKAWTQPSSTIDGIANYDLEKPAKSLIPFLTPLRNRIPRMLANGGIQANWRAFTGVNTGQLDIGVSDGNRNAVMTSTYADYFAKYCQIGLEDYVTWGARMAAEDFMDLASRAQTNLLWSVMVGEELLDLGGCGTAGLGQGNAPTLSDVSTGGSLSSSTAYSVIVAPLTLQGFVSGSIAAGVRGAVTRTNADGSSDTYGGGTGKPSSNTTVTTGSGANTHSIAASTALVPGAVAYAWFWGPTGSEVLGAITTLNSLVITATATGTQTAASLGASDNSQNVLVYDGILTQLARSGSGSYVANQATGTAGTGTPLTADGAGGVVEIDTALKWFWDNHRLSPSTIWVSSQEQLNITHKVLAGNSVAAQRFIINTDQGNVKSGDLVTSYLNKFGLNGSQQIPIKLHPNMPPGTLLFDTEKLPYPLNDVPEVLVKRLRQDYFATLWAPRSRKYEYGVYFDGVLQNYFPPAFGVITNIANG